MSSGSPGSRAVSPTRREADEAQLVRRVEVTETTLTESSLRRNLAREAEMEADLEGKIAEVTHQAATAHQLTWEQLRVFQDKLEQTHQYLKDQYANQVELNKKQADLENILGEKLKEHQAAILESLQATAHQDQRIEALRSEMDERARARSRSRWGYFGEGNDEEMSPIVEDQEPKSGMMIATGANMPQAPLYRGKTERDKRSFMDAYLIYERKVKLLNQSSGTKVYLMPVRGCIDHKTMVRICKYEFQKTEDELTENDWRAYFLDARVTERVDLARLKQAMSRLKMKTHHPGAKSRVGELVADFESVLDSMDAESFSEEEPKLCVGYLVEALEPRAFRETIRLDLKLSANKHFKTNVPVFLKWMQEKLQTFLQFEPELISTGLLSRGHRGDAKSPAGNRKQLPHASASRQATTRRSDPPPQGPEHVGGHKNACLKCGSTAHGVFRCPGIDRAEAKALWRNHKNQRESSSATGPTQAVAAAVEVPGHENAVAAVGPPLDGTASQEYLLRGVANGGVEVLALTDFGAAGSVVSQKWLDAVQAQDPTVRLKLFEKPITTLTFAGHATLITHWVSLTLQFDTPGGPLVLKNVKCWVVPVLPRAIGDVLLSRDVMRRLGYDPHRLVEDARQQCPVFDMTDENPPATSAVAALSGQSLVEIPEEETKWEGAEELVYFPMSVSPRDQQTEVLDILRAKVEECRTRGMSESGVSKMWRMLVEYQDCFRVRLGHDPPVDMPPLKVRKKPDAQPVRCKARRYPEAQRAFMKEHVEELRDAGLVYRNPNSAWCSPPLIVKKPGINQYRMTVDVRAVNGQTERIVWPMPILEVVLGALRGARFFFSLDFFKGYWQFALDVQSQELFSFVTDEGVFTPTRVLMGGSDSVAYCQSTVQEMFSDVLYQGLLVWLDDLLGYDGTEAGLLKLLKKVLERCESKGLKLNPSKCAFFLTEALWCGRIVSGDGVRHNPERVAALEALPTPTTGADLQQFVCAVGWMRTSIPAHNVVVKPLTDLLEKVYEVAGGRTKRKAASVKLCDVGWMPVHDKCVDEVKLAIARSVQLSHPDPTKLLCVFADASDLHWGAVITQIPPDQRARSLEEQEHEPLMFLSGTFTKSAQRWAIVEKEAFSIVESCKRADFLLHGSSGFCLFTDHRNLRFIFDPHSVHASVPKYTADKLQRWALLLMGYNYTIFDIPGEVNVWADLLSRWGSSRSAICAIHLADVPLSPQLDSSFDWPSLKQIRLEQCRALREMSDQLPEGFRLKDGLVANFDGIVWIPEDASQLQTRLLVVAHFGVAGHRGIEVTTRMLQKWCHWQNMKEDAAAFVRRCLHCASDGRGVVPRPLGEALHATKPNELIHWDYLHMGPTPSGLKYVLVIKDDASQYVWLKACATADADVTYDTLMEWFAAFGVSYQWVSDQGTHFKNEVIQAFQHALGAHHHFTTARCPWANGTVERVNAELLRCTRKLLSEWKLPTDDWARVLPVVQIVLNQTPSPAMEYALPITVMTGIEPKSPIERIMIPDSAPLTSISLEELADARQTEFDALKEALTELHKVVAAARANRRAEGRAQVSRTAKMAQFDIGDFVLYAEVWTRPKHKLQMRWCGPAEVVGTISNWIFRIKNLITKEEREVHASRLKFYADSQLDVSGALLDHVAHNSEGHVVDELLDCRYNEKHRRYELLVQWRGLARDENSWEPAGRLWQDIPAVIKNYIKEHAGDPTVTKMASTLAKNLGGPANGKGSVVPAGTVPPRRTTRKQRGPRGSRNHKPIR